MLVVLFLRGVQYLPPKELPRGKSKAKDERFAPMSRVRVTPSTPRSTRHLLDTPLETAMEWGMANGLQLQANPNLTQGHTYRGDPYSIFNL
jgi:hypothetical protein